MADLSARLVNRDFQFDRDSVIRWAKSALWNFRAAQILALAFVALPVGWIAGSLGFSQAGLVTFAVMGALALSWLWSQFVKTIWFWWTIWLIAAGYWFYEIFNYLIHARHILADLFFP